MKIYNISKGQLIMVWVFGAVSMFFSGAAAANGQESGAGVFWIFVFYAIPPVLIFYTIGWMNNRKKHSK